MDNLKGLNKNQLIEEVKRLQHIISNNKNTSSGIENNLFNDQFAYLSGIDNHFMLLMEQSPSVIEIYSREGLQIAVNKAYEVLWGVPASTTVGKFNVLKSKEVIETGLIEYLNRAYKGESVKVPEYKFNPKGKTESGGFGRERWLSTHVFPLKNKNGDVINIVITHEDISDRKEIEFELNKSDKRFFDLFETINSGVAIYKVKNDGKSGKDYIIQDFNKAALELEGLTKDQVRGKSLIELRPNIDNFGLIPIFREVWKTGKSAFFPAKEYVDDRYANYYENRVFKLSSGEIVAVYDDVTEKENAHNEVRKSQERFDIAMKASKDGLYDWNLVTNEIYFSPGWKGILGYKDNELSNDFSIWETLTEPDDVAKSWAMLNDLINKKIDRFEMEFKMKHKDGHWVDILSRAESIFNDEGKAIRVIGTHVDISELKSVKREIELISAAIENSDTAYDIIDSTGKFIYVNKAFLNLWGYDNKDEIIGVKPEDIVTETTAPKEIQRKVLEHGEFSKEVLARKKNGDYFDALISAFLFKDENEDVYYCTETADITEQKKTRESLKESEERFRGLFESKLIGQMFWNADGDITDANQAFLDMMGYTIEELINKDVDWKDMTPLEYAEKDEQLLAELVEKGVITPFEKEYFHKDGHRIPIMIGAATLPGHTTNGVAFVLDISNQKEAELESKKLRNTLELAQKMTNIGFWSFNVQTQMPTWSDQMYVMLGVNKKNGPLTYEEHKKIWHPNDWEMFDSAVQRCIKGEPYDIVVRIILPDGSLNYLNTQGFPRFDKEGNLEELFGTSIDITSLKTTEEELRKHKENLEHLINQRTEELRQKNTELDNAIKVFVGREKTINELQKRIRLMESNL